MLFFLFPRSVHGQESWQIENYSSNIFIQKSGEVQVTEDIFVDFNQLDKHGILRTIPYIYHDADGKKTYTEIKDISVANHRYSVSKEGDFIQIKIGDPDKTVSGKQEYKIQYTVVGVLRGFDAYDELYWNVTGNDWDVPIQKASAVVKLEAGNILETACYQGETGSTKQCAGSAEGRSTFFESSDPLAPNNGMTVAVSYPKGVIALPVVQSFGQKLLSPLSLVVFGLTLVLGTFGIFYVWSTKGRDLLLRGKHLFDPEAKEEKRPLLGNQETIVVEYESPDRLRPAEIGVLVDERADTLDVTSTIIDLATRGYFDITEEKKKWMFGSTDYILKKKKTDTKELLAYEKELLDRLFKDGDSVKISSLKQEFYKDLKIVKNQLYTDVVEKGLFPDNPEKVRGKYRVVGIILLVLFGVFISFAREIEQPYLFMGSLAGILTAINLIFVSFVMPRRTAKGAELNRRVKGYRLFIENVEKHRQKFFEKENMFNEVLPYAIVFGLTKKFAKAMENMGVTPDASTVAWYHGTGAFNLSQFENSMTSFSKSMSSAMASTPSSSGSGGGGSSGGGFGGGGGGSW